MEVILINRPLNRNEENSLIEQLIAGKDTVHLFSNVVVSERLVEFSKGSIELSDEEKKEINYKMFDHVLNFGENMVNGKAITDLLMVENASIWHYHKFRTYFFIRNLMFEIRLIEKLTSQYEKIVYYGESAFLKKYPFKFPGLTLNIKETKKKSVRYSTIINYAIFFSLRVRIALFQLPKLKNTKHIVIDHSIRQTCLNIHTLKPELGNYNLEYLFDKLDKGVSSSLTMSIFLSFKKDQISN